MMMYIGTAAWNIPKIAEGSFIKEGTVLERYANRLNAVEINTSFYRDHKPETYQRWARTTPENFRFSVKLNQRFTHKNDLIIDREDLLANLIVIKELGKKLGPLLLQFPAGQSFHTEKMENFYETIRAVHEGPIVLEARNSTWLYRDAIKLMKKYRISKVTADPEKCPGEFENEIEYYRLHGSPEMYISDYSPVYLDNLVEEMKTFTSDVWCIFDNTTFGYATLNALAVYQKGEVYESYQRIHDSGHTDVHAIDQH
nr:DUF72 domain-containing protein [Bacteriovorax sp. HI3]